MLWVLVNWLKCVCMLFCFISSRLWVRVMVLVVFGIFVRLRKLVVGFLWVRLFLVRLVFCEVKIIVRLKVVVYFRVCCRMWLLVKLCRLLVKVM